jgi:diguanylate cyclase (GGDEF)-like protein
MVADREEAVADRTEADRDLDHTRAELRLAQLDQLTGVFGRGIGMLLLESEIDRAHHGNGLLVLAYIDVDGLKQFNDRQGHAAGDQLLRDVTAAVQEHLRSYDTLVRVGGDEFVCALGDCTPAMARSRFQTIRATLQQTQPAATISVGFAELRPQDTLEQLTHRGDLALYEAKRDR